MSRLNDGDIAAGCGSGIGLAIRFAWWAIVGYAAILTITR